MMQRGYLWELQHSPHLWRLFVAHAILCFFIFILRHNVCNSIKFIHSAQAFYCSVMYKRKHLNQQRSGNVKKPKPRALIGKPSQSVMSIALQLKEASERLSANGFPSASQFIDVTKPEPVRMDFDASMISPVTVAAPTLTRLLAREALREVEEGRLPNLVIPHQSQLLLMFLCQSSNNSRATGAD